jgi:hypothetical protein
MLYDSIILKHCSLPEKVLLASLWNTDWREAEEFDHEPWDSLPYYLKGNRGISAVYVYGLWA